MRKVLIGLLALIGLAGVVATAGYFALRRPDIPLATLERTYANAQSRYVDLPGGVRMHYRDEGKRDGPIVLLVHGFSASLHTWAPWVERLGDRYRMVSLDLPGHGLTSAPANYRATIPHYVEEVEAFARAQNLASFTIVGNSMGGNVAWEYTLAHPERVEALVLVDSSGWEETRAGLADDPPIFRLLRNPVLGPLMRDLDNSRLARQGLRASFNNPDFADDAMLARYIELARAPGHRDILLQLTLGFRQRRYATNELLGRIRAPTLILQGERDNLVPPDHARKFAAAIPGSELVTWADEGHIPMEEHPDRSAQVLADFLRRVLPRSVAAQPNVTQTQ
jgi:pimeloyl-ACP methyl ester carboxylesterase